MNAGELARILTDTCKRFETPWGECKLDIKRSLSDPRIMLAVGLLVVERAAQLGVLPDAAPESGTRYVVGMGSGGSVMEHSVAMASLVNPGHGYFQWMHFNDPDARRGKYLPHFGANPDVGSVLIVDDVIRSGGTISELAEQLDDEILSPTAAIALVDYRSRDALLPEGLPVHSVFRYNERLEVFVPA